MFGFIHESIRQLMIRKYGEDFWNSVLERTGFENGKENIRNHHYPDSETYKLVECVSSLSNISSNEIWELYGAFLFEYLVEIGWDDLLKTLSSNLKGFLDTLDALHYFVDNVVFKANLRGPSFRCEEQPDGSLILHYTSARQGLFPIVQGVVRSVAKVVFERDVTLTVTGRTQRMVATATGERLEEHVVFKIRDRGGTTLVDDTHSMASVSSYLENGKLQLGLHDFTRIFPYHVVVDQHCRLQQYGSALIGHVPRELLTLGTPLVRLFRFIRPNVPVDYENILNFINSVFVVECRSVGNLAALEQENDTADNKMDITSLASSVHSTCSSLKLKGQMIILRDGRHIMYIASPYVTTIGELFQSNLRINSLPLHDMTRDLILLNQHRISQVAITEKLDETTNQLEQMAADMETEKQKGQHLLLQVLPESVARQLMDGKSVDACEYEEATIMFTDVPSFNNIVQESNPRSVVNLLNELFTLFDRLVEIHNVYKVETVGDSYMIVAGAPEISTEHCEAICNMALGMLWEATNVMDPSTKTPIVLRAGIHTGPIVTGVVGKKMPRYCLFGDTVNTASRMESHGLPGRIHCSAAVYEKALSTGRFEFLDRGRTFVKGKGEMQTYFLTGSQKRSLWEIVQRERDRMINSIGGYRELNRIAEPLTPTDPSCDKIASEPEKRNHQPQKSSICGLM